MAAAVPRGVEGVEDAMNVFGRVYSRLVIGAIVLTAAWAALALWIVPTVIRSAYAGSGPAILNRLINGQDVYPPEYYVSAWLTLAAEVTAVVVAAAILAAAAYSQRDRIRRLVDGPLGRWVGPSSPIVKPLALLGMAWAMGVAFGLTEWMFVGVRRAGFHLAAESYSSQAFWMTPLAVGFSFLLLVLPFASAAAIWPRAGVLCPPVLVLTAVGYVALIESSINFLGTRLLGPALWILSLGVAYRTTVWICSWTPRARRRARFAAVTTTSLVLLGGVAQTVWRREVADRAFEGLPAPPPGSPNILIVILDTVRAASLSVYGYERETTPHLQALAREGVVFDRAIAPAPWTLPSHASLLAGRVYRPKSWQSPLVWSDQNLATALSARGYATAAVVGNLYYLTRFYGVNRGFEHYDSHPATVGMVVESSAISRWLRVVAERRVGVTARRHPNKPAEEVNSRFLAWLERDRGGRPFFAMVNYIDAHDPYAPPEPYFHRYLRPEGRHRLGEMGAEYSAQDLEDLRAAYDGAVAYVDAQVGRLLADLDSRNLRNETLVIVVSDHGEEFLEHGLMGHSNSLYLPSLRVPLLIRFPGSVPTGLRVEESVGLIDVPSTVWELVFPEEPTPFGGRSLTRFWSTETDVDDLELPIYSEVIGKDPPPPDSYPVGTEGLQSTLWGDWHYILHPDGGEELYDIAVDAAEQTNIVGTAKAGAVIEPLRAAHGVGARAVVVP